MCLTDKVVQLAYDPGIKPNEGGLPGLAVRKQVMAVLLRSEKDRRAFDALSGRVLDAPRVLETEAVDVTPPPDQPDPPEEEPLPEIGVELDPEAPPEPAPPEDSPTP